jgi:hypothetical protein
MTLPKALRDALRREVQRLMRLHNVSADGLLNEL